MPDDPIDNAFMALPIELARHAHARFVATDSPGDGSWAAKMREFVEIYAQAMPINRLAPMAFMAGSCPDPLRERWMTTRPAPAAVALGNYLAALPDFDEERLLAGEEFPPASLDQHGYRTMHLFFAMSELSDHFSQCAAAGIAPGDPSEWPLDHEDSQPWIRAALVAKERAQIAQATLASLAPAPNSPGPRL